MTTNFIAQAQKSELPKEDELTVDIKQKNSDNHVTASRKKFHLDMRDAPRCVCVCRVGRGVAGLGSSRARPRASGSLCDRDVVLFINSYIQTALSEARSCKQC